MWCRTARSDAAAPRGEQGSLTIAAALMLGWGALAFLLLARLGRALWSTHKLIRQADPLAPQCLPVDLEALPRAAGIRRTVRWATDARLHSPAVGGLIRPTVVLPPGLDDELTPKQALEKRVAETNARAALPSRANREAPPVGGDGSPGPAGNVGGYNTFWLDSGTELITINGEKRTSILIDPPDGRVPPMTPARLS